MLRVLALALASSVVAVSARADTLHVPQDFETIQAAVIAAQPGDTIVIKAGFYAESVLFDDRHDLVVRGSGKVFVNPDVLSTAIVLQECSGIELVNLRFTSSEAPGLYMSDCSDISVSKCRFEPEVQILSVGPADTPQPGTVGASSSTGLVFDHCSFVGQAANALGLGATGGNVFDVLVQHCHFEQIAQNGIDIIDVEQIQIVHNVFENIADRGVRVGPLNTFQDMTIAHNRFEAMEDGVGVEAGAGPLLVEHNVLRDLSGNGVSSLVGGTVNSNSVRDVLGVGIFVAGTAQVAGNSVRDCGGSGIAVEGNGFDLQSNKIRSVGQETLLGAIDIDGNSGLLAKNAIKLADKHAFSILGSGSQISHNKAVAAGDDGFHVSGDINELDHDVSTHAGGDGFELNGMGTVLSFNKASGSGGFDLFDHFPGQNDIDESNHFGTEHP